MAVTNHANAAAAVAAGYRKVQIDRGVPGVQDKNPAPRYATIFDKSVTGAPGDSGRRFEAMGESTVDANGADAAALIALNTQLQHYYGGSPGRASGSSESQTSRGGTHTQGTT